jgi:DNA-binding beta-propeller fold protein YncE
MRYTLFIFCIAGLVSCKPNEKPIQAINIGQKVLVCNEGNFGWGNADFDIYNKNTGELSSSVFNNANGTKLGDVLQSGIVWNGELYLVINNSGKIAVIDTGSFKLQRTLSGFVSPRYIEPINTSKALVTDLYANTVYVIDKQSGITQKIAVRGRCEQMAANNTTIAIACHQGMTYFFDKVSEKITDSAVVPNGAGQLQYINGQWFTMAKSGQKSIIYSVNPGSSAAAWDTTSHNANYSLFQFHQKLNKWLFLEGHKLVLMNNDFSNISTVYDGGPANFYGLRIDPDNGDIYLANAKNYTSNGEVIRLNSAFNELAKFTVGLIPGEFIFMP